MRIALNANEVWIPEKFSVAREVLNNKSARTEDTKQVDRAPAANIPLSAACRCASYSPSVPSVLPPESRTQSEMAGFSCIYTRARSSDM